MQRLSLFLALALAVLAGPALAQSESVIVGGDYYGSGQTVSPEGAVEGDVFASGYDVTVASPVGGDAHLAGFNVRTNAPVTGNIYAGGFSVTVNSPVGQDVSAMGNSVDIQSEVAGNVRAAGSSVIIGGPVDGTVVVAAGSVTLSGAVAGDMNITAGNVSFGDGASVGGQLHIRSSEPVDVPASVASADRVTFEQVEAHEQAFEQTNVGVKMMTSPWVLFFGGLLWVGVLLVVGLIILALMPKRAERTSQVAVAKPWWSLLAGALTLAMLIGLVPVLAITLIGIPLIPVLLILGALVWLITYLAGGYILGERIMAAFKRSPLSLPAKMVTLVIGLVLIWAVGLIPIIGWLAVEALMFVSLGAITLSLTLRWFDPELKAQLDAPAD